MAAEKVRTWPDTRFFRFNESLAHWSFDSDDPGRYPLAIGGTVASEEGVDGGAMGFYGDRKSF